MRKSELKIAATILMVVVIIMFFLYAGTYLGLPANTAEKFTMVLPGIVIFFIGVAGLVSQGRSIFALPAFLGVGIGLAILVGELNTQNIVVPSLATGGITVGQMQQFIIILCGLLGGVIAGSSLSD